MLSVNRNNHLFVALGRASLQIKRVNWSVKRQTAQGPFVVGRSCCCQLPGSKWIAFHSTWNPKIDKISHWCLTSRVVEDIWPAPSWLTHRDVSNVFISHMRENYIVSYLFEFCLLLCFFQCLIFHRTTSFNLILLVLLI